MISPNTYTTISSPYNISSHTYPPIFTFYDIPSPPSQSSLYVSCMRTQPPPIYYSEKSPIYVFSKYPPHIFHTVHTYDILFCSHPCVRQGDTCWTVTGNTCWTTLTGNALNCWTNAREDTLRPFPIINYHVDFSSTIYVPIVYHSTIHDHPAAD